MDLTIYFNILLPFFVFISLLSILLYIKNRIKESKIKELESAFSKKLDEIDFINKRLTETERELELRNCDLLRWKEKYEQIDSALFSQSNETSSFKNLLEEKTGEIDSINRTLSEIEKESEQRNRDLLSWKEKYAHVDDVNNEYTYLTKKMDGLRERYKASKSIYDLLGHELVVLNENRSETEFGFYEQQHSFGTSEEYQEALKTCIEKQKNMCKEMEAIQFINLNEDKQERRIDPNDEADVEKFKKNAYPFAKNALRAFNSECYQIIQSCKWNNANRLKEKIYTIRKQIDKANEFKNFTICDYRTKIDDGRGFVLFDELHIRLSGEYVQLKIQQLELFHEHLLQKKKERDEQAEFRAKIREETKVAKEYEQIKKVAEQQEESFQGAIEKARLDAQNTHGEKLKYLEAQIEQLTASLLEAREQKERAISMAQQTRRGHVYIISNVGTMGKGVLKIGMTRRLDPLDRITELGDASVPFKFDVHAMISTEDAPALEKALHQEFKDKRVNLANNRKEFFYVTLDEIKEVLPHICEQDIEINEDILAKEYFDSLAIREMLIKKESNEKTIKETVFPEAI